MPLTFHLHDQTRIRAEALFLRGHYHFEGVKMWNKIPYINEDVTDFNVPNDIDIWDSINRDLKFAYDNLPGTMANKGRVNKYAAGALLGKAYLFQKKFAEALTILRDVHDNGTTATGAEV